MNSLSYNGPTRTVMFKALSDRHKSVCATLSAEVVIKAARRGKVVRGVALMRSAGQGRQAALCVTHCF